MKTVQAVRNSFAIAFLVFAIPLVWPQACTAQNGAAEFRGSFLKLCDVAAGKVQDPNSRGPFFIDSYAVRALCVAYDMTGNTNYLDACRAWSERMIAYQEKMTPPGAYYMHYNRKPGETNGDWYTADSSSIGMAVLATSVRCKGEDQQRFLDSARVFADLVIKNYIKPSGGASDGLWSKSSDAWWCSSGLFGSLVFRLYAQTGDERYLKPGLSIVDWLNQLDLTKDQPFPLSQQGPAMIMYVMEAYSSGWPYIIKDHSRRQAALAKVSWCLDWIAKQEETPVADRAWAPTKGWGMKFGGLPFHQYIFSHYLPEDGKLIGAGDAEMRRLAKLVFADEPPKFTQLSVFILMSYAERLDPGAIYRSVRRN